MLLGGVSVLPNPSTWADSSLLGTSGNVLMLQWVGVGIFRRLKCTAAGRDPARPSVPPNYRILARRGYYAPREGVPFGQGRLW